MGIANTSLSDRYFNRELSWLAFNTRVMEEAQNTDYPVLERLRFLAISANNLDEFYMVRVAGLRTHVITNMPSISLDGQSASEQLGHIRKHATKLVREQQGQWKALRKDLNRAGIKVKSVKNLKQSDNEALHTLYENDILPLLTPMAIDPAHPFPFIPNFGLGLILSFSRQEHEESRKALIIVPAHVPRFICIKSTRKRTTDLFVWMRW